jgi:hypothetical protein
MKLKQRTQTEIDIENIEKSAETFLLATKSAICSLNDAYHLVWSLPEDRLLAVLQDLLDNGKLTELLNNHLFAATCLNEILSRVGENGGAISVAAKQFSVDQNGKVFFIQPPSDIE